MDSTQERILAFSHTYRFFSQLYLGGPDAELLGHIFAIPELAGSLGLPPGRPVSAAQLDELKADHYQVFGLGVFPYESIFLEAENILEGAVSDSVRQTYQRAGGFQVLGSHSPDHLGLELNFLGQLCQQEAEARETNQAPLVREYQQRQLHFMSAHLLHWLPAFRQAVHQEKQAFYHRLADLTFELVLEHYGMLAGVLDPEPQLPLLPNLPDLLGDEATSLRDITRFLLTPSFSGVYLSRGVISGLARGQKLPHGFGDREQMLLNLFRSAAEYEQFPALIDRLRSLVAAWQEYFTSLEALPQIGSFLHPWTAPWVSRTNHTAGVLAEIRAQAYAQ